MKQEIKLQNFVSNGDMKCLLMYWHNASAGLKDREAANFLEREMKNNPSLSFAETIQMAISALQFALKEDLKATEIEVGIVRKDDPIFRILTAAQIDKILAVINPVNQS
nr:unnamed protein product [Digitaria exilis]